MARFSYPLFFFISHLSLLSLAQGERSFDQRCQNFHCGNLGYIGFPFSNWTHPECGLMVVDDCNEPVQKIQLGKEGPWYNITNISENNTITLEDQVFQKYLENRSCESFKNFTFPPSPLLSFEIISNLTLFKCPPNLHTSSTNFSFYCKDSLIFYNFTHTRIGEKGLPSLPPRCSLIQLPANNKTQNTTDLFNLFTGVFSLQVHVPLDCFNCHGRGGQCQLDRKGNFFCCQTTECYDCDGGGGTCLSDGNKNKKLKLGLGIGGGVGFFLIGLLCVWFICRQKKQKYASRNIHSGNTSSLTPSKSDLETGTVYFGVPIFSYSDLADATNNFNHEKELGDGGFGTVYYGKLRDGREVAVKRLYEHNYRRVEQFMNEIEILTRLRHKNLVSLYGCTSRHSQGLLLVYEFVPNGTVADHLHGGRAKPCLLSWPIRMNIAIETASALAYLHASDIIHRDVKTNNILLDNNFGVKVADFGLSRLFPTDVTHISTAPQGTPGYVDPEYHQCYQLTDKSDVYSFGVVLIELISSMPAVDITRHRHEINLANLAMNKIQKCAFDELIDPCLGYHSDEEVKRMTTSVAELAFLCLQQNKEMRPSMDEVLEELERIQSGEPQFENQKEKQDNVETFNSKQKPPPSPCCDEVSLLKNMRLPSSPISVTEKWEEKWFNSRCQPFPCGNLGYISFPFSNRTHPECGLMIVDDCNEPVQKIQLGKDGPWFNITNIYQNLEISLENQVFQNHLDNRNCESLKNLSLPSFPFLSFEIPSNLTLFKCPPNLNNKPAPLNLACNDSVFYFNRPKNNLPSLPPPQCSIVHLPVNKTKNTTDLFKLLTGFFSLQVLMPSDCFPCHERGGRCQSDSKGNYYCAETIECRDCSQTGNNDLNLKLGLGLGGGILGLFQCICFTRRHKKQKYASRNTHSGNISSLPPSKSDLETCTVYFGVSIFSYGELADATNNFSYEKELGDGGFGTVYYGKLRDGREVAVKRLYEHNYRRVEQFMNEIEILTRLRHTNLVSIYGCTSLHSQGLLLVYEFVPNGTVSDHLHGDRAANPGLLSWPIRMNIAIETASALAYLHASDIIHRDVKTDNILLDNNFGVKVADFGISRLFPTDVTHVSTAPQGTPGYIDPEYHECYRLTDKSDVYSFGVVLIELISSRPAVDVTRHRDEIDLAHLARNRIQKCAVDELIDPCLGYHSDEEVKRMTTSVAELAFRCLQLNREMRPPMHVVLKELERIQSGEPKFENQKEKQGDVSLLKI